MATSLLSEKNFNSEAVSDEKPSMFFVFSFFFLSILNGVDVHRGVFIVSVFAHQIDDVFVVEKMVLSDALRLMAHRRSPDKSVLHLALFGRRKRQMRKENEKEKRKERTNKSLWILAAKSATVQCELRMTMGAE